MKSANYNSIVERNPSDLANQLLTITGQDAPPANLDGILNSEKIRIVYAPLEETGYLVDQKGKFACILVNKNTVESRRSRFTLAHELGHWVLHRFAEKALEKGPPVRAASDEEVERWCDRFAAELLVPSRWLERFAGQFERLGRGDVIFAGPETFGVSKEAFYIRLEETYRVLIAEITASGKMTFWSKRPPADPQAWEKLSSQVSKLDYELLENGPICKGPTRISYLDGPRWTVLIVRRD